MQTESQKLPVESQKLSVVEKVGYGLGDASANLIFQVMMILQMIFYTDAFGITPLAAGILLGVARIWDGIFDPVMGLIADRTNTRWGKFRPWILWTAIPFGVMAFLCFYTPKFSNVGKLLYAYITYIGFMTIYSMNNLPYSALSGVATSDIGDRTSLSSYRQTCAMLAGVVVQGLAMPLVAHFGKRLDGTVDKALGYKWTIGIFSIIGIFLFFITFITTKERIKPDPKQKTSVGQDFADLLKNGPWIILFLLTIFIFITLAMRGGDIAYLFTYYFDKGAELAVLQSSRLLSVLQFLHIVSAEPNETDIISWSFSVFSVSGLIATILGIISSKWFAIRMGKRNAFILGLATITILWVPFYFLTPTAVWPAIILQLFAQFGYGITAPLLWAMMADVADYSEWMTGRRATAIVFAAVVFGLKAGIGVGGAIGGWILGHYGYMANVAQSERALIGIRLTASIFPAIPFGIGVILLLLYKINKPMELQMQNELTERRKQYKY
ncbi:MAG: MFS transporter [Sedimentisphaerales bacterium]